MGEFYDIMTLATAYIYHDVLGLDFVIEDGHVSEIKKAPHRMQPSEGAKKNRQLKHITKKGEKQ